MLTGNDETVCKHCEFTLHCGCCYDDHAYKLETCGYYALWCNYQRLLDRLADYIKKYEGGTTHDTGN